MKTLNGILVLLLCICIAGSGVAGTTQNVDSSMAVSEWTADYTACPAVTLDNVAALTQLVQIGKGEPLNAAWSPDGEVIALATGTGVHLFDGHSLQLLDILQSGHTKKMMWSQDGALLALCLSASAGDEIQVWDVLRKENKYSISQKRIIDDLYIDQKNSSLLVLSQHQTGTDQYGIPQYKAFLDKYNLKTGKKLDDTVSYIADDKNLMNLSLSGGGDVVFGAGLSRCYLWNARGKLLYSAPIAYPMYAFSVSGTNLSVILDYSNLSSLQIIDRVSKQKISDVTLPESVGGLALNEETQELILRTWNGYLVYSLESQEILANVSLDGSYTGSIWISGDKSHLFQIDGAVIRLVDLHTESLLGEQSGYEVQAGQVAVCADRLIASKGSSYGNDTRFYLWDFDTLESIAVVEGPEFTGSLSDILFLPEKPGTLLLPRKSEFITYEWGDEALKVWNASDGSKSRDIELTASVYSMALSKDGTMLAVGHGGYAGVLQVAGTGYENKYYMSSFVNGVTLCGDGSKMAACDGTLLVVWDTVTQSEIFHISDEDLVAAEMSADGEKIAVLYSGQDGDTVKMTNANTGGKIWTQKLPDNFCNICYAPDGSMLVISAYQDGLIFLNTETGKEVYILKYDVSDFAFSEDGRFIITASSDGTIRLWGVIQE